MVISSFCRACGEHFRVRRGVAEASPGLRVSGIAETRPPRRRAVPVGGPAPAGAPDEAGWLVDSEENEVAPQALTRPEPAGEPAEPDGISAGAFFGLAGEETSMTSDPSPGRPPAIGQESQDRDVLGQGSIAALMGSQQTILVAERDRMPPNYVAPDPRRRRDDSVPGMEVRCYRCYHIQSVSRYAKSTQCERCSAYISLADYEIKTVKSHTLRTRGDVTIARRGGLVNHSEIACRHLLVNGAIDARVDCTGDAVFRHSGTVRGHLYCKRLVIEKNCELRFPDGVMTARAEIAGHLVGDLTCSGKVSLARTGIVEGTVRAAEVESKEGGRVSGETVIDAETKTDLPLRKGFNPSVIG